MVLFDRSQSQKVVSFCKKRAEVVAVYLFGSQTKGTVGLMSDIDLAFLVEPALIRGTDLPYGYRAFLLTELMSILGTNDLDLIVLNEVPPLLKFQVIYHGEVIFSRSEGKRRAFQIKAFNEYQDVRPLLAVQRHYLMGRLDRQNIVGAK